MTSTRRIVLTVATAYMSSSIVLSQATFEVAVIRPSSSLNEGGTIAVRQSGRLEGINVPLSVLISYAYRLRGMQVVDGPDWIRRDRFNLEAKAEGPASPDQLRDMLRALLAERFKLRSHRETRELQGFTLVRLMQEKLGPDLQPSTLDCDNRAAPQPKPSRFECAITYRVGHVRAGHVTMVEIASTLTAAAGGLVVDKTNLPGNFDYELQWSTDQEPSDYPSIFTAVQEQLGLKLEPGKVPVDVLVVDHAERPTDN